MPKTLVTYFSASGRTAKTAKHLAELAKADVFEIKPVQKYSGADLNWNNANSRSSVEMKDPNSRPEIADKTSVENYDVIFVGFPIWWYVAPHIILTFLESYDFAGKTVVPFATSGGSGVGETEKHLHTAAPNAKWESMRMLNRVSDSELKSWLESLGI